MEYIALQIYRSANFRQKRQTFQVASFVCVYARIHIGSADFGLITRNWSSHSRRRNPDLGIGKVCSLALCLSVGGGRGKRE